MGARSKRGSREKAAPPERSRLWKAALLAFAVTWLAALVRWWPLTQYPVWGSDQGEYAGLLDTYLVTGGTLPGRYLGWGGGYPDFKGMYVLAGTFAQISGVDSFVVLSAVVPAAASLSALFAFAIALRLSSSLRAATLAGAIAATAMPEAFAGSHAMPGALGGMLAVAILAAVVLASREPAIRAVLVVLTLALVPTHHLSSFLAAAMLTMAALAVAKMAPADIARSRTVDAALLGASSLIMFSALFWAWGAPHFRAVVLDSTSVLMARILPWLALLGVVGLVVLAWFLETLPRSRARFRAIFDEAKTLRRFGLASLATVVAVVVLGTVGVPGTTAVVPLASALPFIPLGLALAAASAGPGRLAPVPASLVPLAAALGIIVSGVLGAALIPTVLIPYRHLQYFVGAVAPLSAVALTFAARAVALRWAPGRRGLQRPIAAALVSALVAGCALTSFPPKEALVGYQEGTSAPELAAVVWLQWNVPTTVVATDHRLSSVVYGFAHHDATWEAAAPLLVGNASVALQALGTVQSPRGANGITVVLLSDDLVAGAALSQWTPATPIGQAALDKFDDPPFVRAFDNGDAVAYWVVR